MIRILIFDIGGVLVRINLRRFLHGISQEMNIPRWRLYFYRNRKLFDAIMRGEATISALHTDIMRFFNREMAFSGFEQIWNSILEAPETEMIELARELRQRYKLVLLSNIEAVHHLHLQKTMEFFPYFSAHFMSYQMKLAKPEMAIYQTVISELKVAPEECFFIDDRRENVVAAKKLGIRSHRFRNIARLRQDLQRSRLLDCTGKN